MKSYFLSAVVGLTAVLFFTVFSFNALAHDDNAWSTPTENGWSVCTAKNDCGPEGTQTQTVFCIHKEDGNVDCSTDNDAWRYADKVRGDDNDWKCPSKDSAYTSTDNTKACKRKIDIGPDTKVVSRDCTLIDYNVCPTSTPVDQCINLSGVQSTIPVNMQSNSERYCSCLTGFHQVPVGDSQDFTCDPDITPTPTPTVTPVASSNPSNPGGGTGDGRSDNLGCGSHDCSGNPSSQSTGGQVLGASTGPEVLGLSTTSSDNSPVL